MCLALLVLESEQRDRRDASALTVRGINVLGGHVPQGLEPVQAVVIQQIPQGGVTVVGMATGRRGTWAPRGAGQGVAGKGGHGKFTSERGEVSHGQSLPQDPAMDRPMIVSLLVK